MPTQVAGLNEGQAFTASRDLTQAASGVPAKAPRVYRCCECLTVSGLSDLNDDMLCVACGEPDEDPEDFIDTGAGAMMREHGFYL